MRKNLRGIGEDLLHEVSTTVFDEEELELFIEKQEKRFYEQMQSVIDDIRQKIEESAHVNEEVKEKALSRIRRSFGEMFERIVGSLRDLLN